jgi:cyclophilin family peptidyl-prolyl cis-trans isomerase
MPTSKLCGRAAKKQGNRREKSGGKRACSSCGPSNQNPKAIARDYFIEFARHCETLGAMKMNLQGVFIGCLAFALNATATTPIISSQPQSITINTASTANFTVVAENAATYQWMFGTGAIAGATSATLTLNDVASNQAGAYSVVVTSSTGDSTNSQAAQLTLVPGTIVQLTFSGYAAGGTSNVVLQLFDHDKPATVQNFLHYIVTGAYSNLFWTRCVPGFVLQGGDYATDNRTNGPPPDLIDINSTFTADTGYSPPFPFQIDNEYDVGPLIPNTFGTIAMAKSPDNPDSAVNVFFFNLADNSTNLDNQNGGFTVFGRILSGTNILEYFNTFSTPTIYDHSGAPGAPTNGLFNSGEAPFDSLPVNYFALTTPGDSNFFYVDFTFLTPPVLDTNPPTVAVVNPANGAASTNADVIVSGTATDNVGLARVVCYVSAPGFNGGAPEGGDATGATNWSFNFGNLPPNTYSVYAVAQDGAGNLSIAAQPTFVVPRFPFNVYTNGPGTLSANLTESNTTVGSSYTVKAIPARGALFVDWTAGTNVSVDPTESFTMPNGLQLTATFIPNTLPGGISFTYPAANAKVATNSVVLTGKVAKNSGLTTITARFFSKTTGDSVTGPMVTTGSSTWSIPAVQLAPGPYIVQALASNVDGKTTVISEDFTVLTPLTVTITGPGKTSIANGTYLQSGTTYVIRATPKPGEFFYDWTDGSFTSISPALSFPMSSGLAFTATFISNGLPKAISFTYPAANSQVRTNSFILTGKVSASVDNPQIVCQLFSNTVPVGITQYATVNGTTWSVPVSDLPQGTYTEVAIATDSAGRQTLISESFKLNFFPNIAGTYYGIFMGTNIATNTAGFFKLTLSDSGVISGKLQFPIYTYTVLYQVNPSGIALLGGGGFDGTEIYFDIEFDLTHGSDSLGGYVYSLGTYASVVGYRAATQLPTNTAAGKYVLNLATITNQATFGPTNDGYATLSVGNTGGLTLGGTLADNETFSEGVGVSKDGVWPVYATLYNGHGMLIGWETNVIGADGSSGSTGAIYWVKAPTRNTYFNDAFYIEAASTGTNYVPPVPGTVYQVVFGGGSVSPTLSNSLTVSKSGQFVPAPDAPDKLEITLSSAGVIKGTIYNPVDNETLTIHGAFSSPTLGGSGFILDPDGQTDPFQITLVP